MGLFDIFGGDRGAGPMPKMDTSGYDKYMGPITGLSESGKLQQKSMEALRQQDLSANRGMFTANNNTNMANAELYGADSGSRERAMLQGMRDMNRATADVNRDASNMQNQLSASDYGMQDARKYDATIGKMNANNQAILAKYGADQAANAAHRKAKSGLFSAIGGIAGTALGGPLGGMSGSALGGLFA